MGLSSNVYRRERYVVAENHVCVCVSLCDERRCSERRQQRQFANVETLRVKRSINNCKYKSDGRYEAKSYREEDRFSCSPNAWMRMRIEEQKNERKIAWTEEGRTNRLFDASTWRNRDINDTRRGVAYRNETSHFVWRIPVGSCHLPRPREATSVVRRTEAIGEDDDKQSIIANEVLHIIATIPCHGRIYDKINREGREESFIVSSTSRQFSFFPLRLLFHAVFFNRNREDRSGSYEASSARRPTDSYPSIEITGERRLEIERGFWRTKLRASQNSTCILERTENSIYRCLDLCKRKRINAKPSDLSSRRSSVLFFVVSSLYMFQFFFFFRTRGESWLTE